MREGPKRWNTDGSADYDEDNNGGDDDGSDGDNSGDDDDGDDHGIEYAYYMAGIFSVLPCISLGDGCYCYPHRSTSQLCYRMVKLQP